MFKVKNSGKEALPDIATCHMACFPTSLATKLGRAYVQKTLEWFTVNPNRFLYHIEDGGRVAGYCGGFKPEKPGDGSSSGMLQHAFNLAIKGILFRPWLIFHPEVRQHYPFLMMNIKRRITGKARPFKPVTEANPFKTYVGLVVIGVHPGMRGNGIVQELMKEFENRVKAMGQNQLILSVKKDNDRAIKAYSNYGWSIKEEHAQTLVMSKTMQG